MKKEYLVYRNFATYYSPVFDTAFNGKFIEAETQVYNIVDFDFPDVFGLVVHWMYSESLCTKWDTDSVAIEDLCRLWVLGDRLMIPKLQDCVATALYYSSFGRELNDDLVPVATWIYEETGVGSPLRRLFAYKCAYELDWQQEIKSDTHTLPVELISEIASVYQRDALQCKEWHWCGNHPFPELDCGSCSRCVRGFDLDEYHIIKTDNDNSWGYNDGSSINVDW